MATLAEQKTPTISGAELEWCRFRLARCCFRRASWSNLFSGEKKSSRQQSTECDSNGTYNNASFDFAVTAVLSNLADEGSNH